MPFHVYILYAPKFDRYYIGQTQNLKARIAQHNELSEHSYTSKYRPWILQTSIQVDSRSKAMRIEKYLKKKPRDFIRRVILDQSLRDYILKTFAGE